MKSLIEMLQQRSISGVPTFLVVEGLDGSGKSSLCKFIASQLAYFDPSIPIITAREPGGTRLGEMIRSIIMDEDLDGSTIILGMVASRVQLNTEVIIPAMTKKYDSELAPVIICDRYIRSSFAYQIPDENESLRNSNRTLVRTLHDVYVKSGKIILPNFEIVLHVDYFTSVRRLSERNPSDLNRLDIVADSNDMLLDFKEKHNLFKARHECMHRDYISWMDDIVENDGVKRPYIVPIDGTRDMSRIGIDIDWYFGLYLGK